MSKAISVIHHDKPEHIKLSKPGRDPERSVNQLTVTAIPASERHKRLLPYINFYNDQRTDRIPVMVHDKPNYQILLPTEGGFQLYTQRNENNKVPIKIQQKTKQNKNITPFLEVNALPGPFIPIRTNQLQTAKVTYAQIPQNHKQTPDYSGLYEQLAHLKLTSDTRNHYKQPEVQINYNDNTQKINLYDAQNYHDYETIQTYTPTNIEIPNVDTHYSSEEIKPPRTYNSPQQRYKLQPIKPFVHQNIATTIPQSSYLIESGHSSKANDQHITALKQILLEHTNPAQPAHQETRGFVPVKFLVAESPKAGNEQKPPPIYVQRRPNTNRKPVTIIDEKYEAQRLPPISSYEYIQQVVPFSQNVTQIYEGTTRHQAAQNQVYQISPVSPSEYKHMQNYEANIKPNQQYGPQTSQNSHPNYEHHVSVEAARYDIPPEDTETFVQILKQLLQSNTLPHTLTPDNVDGNIRTLVYILDKLNGHTVTQSPAIAEQTVKNKETKYDNKGNENEIRTSKPLLNPKTIIQNFPIKTHDGGTPGKAGIDYPALSTIPKTRFNCKTQRYKGFFGDPDTNCQVWHYCDLNGGQASFLCPNGTIFSQIALTCDWWYNVKCSTTTQLYVLNERLYKYILPLSPKFPEDYSGPLVDKYLALKFQEMEEKMRQQKNKAKKTKEKNNSEESQSEKSTDNKREEKTTSSPVNSSEKNDNLQKN